MRHSNLHAMKDEKCFKNGTWIADKSMCQTVWESSQKYEWKFHMKKPIFQAVLNYIIEISWFDQIQINANISTVTTSTTCALIIYLAHSIKGNCCGFEPVCPLCTPSAVHTRTTATCRSSYWRTHKNVNDIQTVILDDGVWSSCSTVLLDFVGASWCGIHCHEMKFEFKIGISGGIGHFYNFELI